MTTVTIKTSPAVGFKRAKRIAEWRMSSDMEHPMTLSWFDHCRGRGSPFQTCTEDGDLFWERYGRARGGVRVDVGPCFSFFVGEAQPFGAVAPEKKRASS